MSTLTFDQAAALFTAAAGDDALQPSHALSTMCHNSTWTPRNVTVNLGTLSSAGKVFDRPAGERLDVQEAQAQAIVQLAVDRLRRDEVIEVDEMFTLYAVLQWEKSGRLPAPIYLSPRVDGWRRNTLEAFIAECAAEKGQVA